MFAGYTQETVDFLWGIRFHNDREWFMPRKELYQQCLLAPTRALGEEVYEALGQKLPRQPLLLKVSRIYRDARRLHGRGPYKDHLWFSISAPSEDWTGLPTFYFEIAPEYYSYGMGFWSPPAELMAAYRRDMEEHPGTLSKLVRRFNRQTEFALTGPAYARPKGDVGALLQPWYQKRSVNLEHTAPLDDTIFSPALAQNIVSGLDTLLPFYRYFTALCAACYRTDKP